MAPLAKHGGRAFAGAALFQPHVDDADERELCAVRAVGQADE
jgi:hypothetical protein